MQELGEGKVGKCDRSLCRYTACQINSCLRKIPTNRLKQVFVAVFKRKPLLIIKIFEDYNEINNLFD